MASTIPKKRGRPPKVAAVEPPAETKKRSWEDEILEQEFARASSPAKKRKDLNGVGIIPQSQSQSSIPASSPYTHSTIARDFTEESTRRIAQSQTTQAGPSGTQDTTVLPGIPSELQSPFVSTTASFKVTVPPVAALYPLEGVLAHYISPLLLTWHPQLDGVLLSYNNANLHTKPPPDSSTTIEDEEQPMAQSIDECAAPYIWLTLECLLFQPRKGLEMEGWLTLQNESHITLILWNFFTVTISQKKLPPSWTWHDNYVEGQANGYDAFESTDAEAGADRPMRRDEETRWGSWKDAMGQDVSGFLRFKVQDWDCAPPGSNGEGSFLSIYGSMLTDEEEQSAQEKERVEKEARSSAGAVRGRGRPKKLVSAMKASPKPATPVGEKRGRGRPRKT